MPCGFPQYARVAVLAVHMGYSSDSERPAKRLKPSQPHRRQPSIPDPSISTPTVTSAMAPDAATFNPWSPPTVAATGFSAEPATLDQMWTWQPSSVDRPPSQAYGLVPSEPQSSWTPPGSAVPAGKCYCPIMPYHYASLLWHITITSSLSRVLSLFPSLTPTQPGTAVG